MSTELFRRLYLESPVYLFAVLTVALLAVSYLLRHYIYARRFSRTDALGVQRFPSYWKMQLVLFVEGGALRAAQFIFGMGLFFLLITAARLIS